MKTQFLTFTLLFLSLFLSAQSEEEAIKQTLQNYIDGSSYNNQELIQSAFYEGAELFLSKKDQELWVLSPEEYANLFKNREQGKFNGRNGKILMVDYANNIASAKAEILIPKQNLKFIDIFLLKKLDDKWKIISKAATQIK
ncbi:nuclear transport factor 2 family protein [Flagellimonas sp. CMM7]|uniref:nuclear transport factor 2 family protein n=1 Tax=Flagellimonas sp. CMM7 TaxID=2654676 RepID=UPI0013CFEDF3|nr:nuclear transport factor 2 family protein [Flagellimonas sp. CMM7]UII81428.1 nuclear transport factor 2 family protein [Flagellimonas sp. CMM7]